MLWRENGRRAKGTSEAENARAFVGVGVVAVLRSLAYVVLRKTAPQVVPMPCHVVMPVVIVRDFSTILTLRIVRLPRVPLGIPPWRPI
jgi:hypothetical protein